MDCRMSGILRSRLHWLMPFSLDSTRSVASRWSPTLLFCSVPLWPPAWILLDFPPNLLWNCGPVCWDVCVTSPWCKCYHSWYDPQCFCQMPNMPLGPACSSQDSIVNLIPKLVPWKVFWCVAGWFLPKMPRFGVGVCGRGIVKSPCAGRNPHILFAMWVSYERSGSLKLEDVWPCRRERWWVVLSALALGQIAPPSTLCIGRICVWSLVSFVWLFSPLLGEDFPVD